MKLKVTKLPTDTLYCLTLLYSFIFQDPFVYHFLHIRNLGLKVSNLAMILIENYLFKSYDLSISNYFR